ncbi:UPF0193 protein EVG1 isoform X2 [Rhinatrema bivittatum]|nr:UPF0193 protein EVG1 isoform X2 [Rhinatrema bivittatum]XP_029446001.1 UPF0193 protein EVG1 isoform X2 [Rhinatrema bivittatum]XP_029446003.1 UPF0193 protein EVG1 isoform X2 [Rhinatrema bivittatum]XP_029446004.1 UPF0193 protein EVG1 isoform X2 [Rhinatrema bivittatum]XP_029446005.1 UPF0193 protein EVG1 isoform X2 [Rhinatrema bivittatum]
MSSQERRGTVPRGTGFWNTGRPAQYSKETQELLRVMMQESKLSSFQQRQINNCLQRGNALPVRCNPTSSQEPEVSQSSSPPSKPCLIVSPTSRPSLRPAESCRAGDAYTREKFKPRPTRDLEKEKRRLQNILATGKDIPEPKRGPPPLPAPIQEEVPVIDRFDELVNEIQERKEFLADMEALGQGKKYRTIIQTEISQKLREMKVIDKKRSSELRQRLTSSGQEEPESSPD